MVAGGIIPCEVVLDETQEDLDFRNTFDVSAVNLEVDERRRGDVGNDGGAVVGCTEELKCREVRKRNGWENFGRSVVQRIGLFKDGSINEV